MAQSPDVAHVYIVDITILLLFTNIWINDKRENNILSFVLTGSLTFFNIFGFVFIRLSVDLNEFM